MPTKLLVAVFALVLTTPFAFAWDWSNVPSHCLKRDARRPICWVPRSLVSQLTPELKDRALQYARENRIDWRIDEKK